MFFESRTKKQVEKELDVATREEEAALLKQEELDNKLEEKVIKYNAIAKIANMLKKDYKEKQVEYQDLKRSVEAYKDEQKEFLHTNYTRRIRELEMEINSLDFRMNLGLFRELDRFYAMNLDKFPNLKHKANEFVDKTIDGMIKDVFESLKSENIADAMHNLSFLVRLEDYFKQPLFVDFCFKRIQNKFMFHFLSNKETSRLDRPEWQFTFLLKEVKETSDQMELYCEARESSTAMASLLIKITDSLITKTFNRLLLTRNRTFVLGFAKAFFRFKETVKNEYSTDLPDKFIKSGVVKTEMLYIHSRLDTIHESSYLQWFTEYRLLIKENISFIASYLYLNHSMDVQDVIRLIILHTKEFLSELNYISREEIQAICLIFSEIEEFKDFLAAEELDVKCNYNTLANYNVLGNSINELTSFNRGVLSLICDLTKSDAKCCIKELGSFMYVTPENKRTFLLKTSKYLEDYKVCIKYDEVSGAFGDTIDEYFTDRVILVYRFDSCDYLDFRKFFKQTKSLFDKAIWVSDQGMECLECIFENKPCDSNLYKEVKKLYE